MINRTDGEQTYLQNITQRIILLREFLKAIDLEYDKDTGQSFEHLAQIKAIQGNINNDISFIACLMAKDYLAAKFKIGSVDMAAKPQGASGLDIDLITSDGEHIIAEIKATVPYSGAKNDLGAKQREAFRHDFNKLNNTQADHKFLFVTDKTTFNIVQHKYISQIPGVKVVLLTATGVVKE
jgi:hypothetical protein